MSTDNSDKMLLRQHLTVIKVSQVKTFRDFNNMPRKGGRQTAQERTFIGAYVARGDATAAAKEAGYAQPRSAASHALARPAIQAEILQLQTARLFNEVLPLAVDVVIDVLTNKAAPAGAKIQAAKLAFDRTLGAQDGAKSKEPHEMTAEEISQAIAELRKVASEKAAIVIDAKPVKASESGVFD